MSGSDPSLSECIQHHLIPRENPALSEIRKNAGQGPAEHTCHHGQGPSFKPLLCTCRGGGGFRSGRAGLGCRSLSLDCSLCLYPISE